MVVTKDGKPLFDILKNGLRHNGHDHLWINPGTKLRVVSDPSEYLHGAREINAIIIEGEASGVSVSPSRDDLRPL